MAAAMPSALPALPDVPTLMSTAPDHETQHNRLNDEVEAIAAYIGTTATSNLTLRYTSTTTRNTAHPSPKVGQLVAVGSQLQINVNGTTTGWRDINPIYRGVYTGNTDILGDLDIPMNIGGTPVGVTVTSQSSQAVMGYVRGRTATSVTVRWFDETGTYTANQNITVAWQAWL